MSAVDVLAVIRKHAATSVALAGSDAYHAQEAPKLVAVAIALAALIEAAERVARTPIETHEEDGHKTANVDAYEMRRLRAKLVNVGGAL